MTSESASPSTAGVGSTSAPTIREIISTNRNPQIWKDFNIFTMTDNPHGHRFNNHPLSDEEIALDASSEGTLSSGGPRARFRSQHGIFICQKKYILDLLAETGMIDCKPAETHMIVNQKLYIDDEAKTVDKDRYQRMVKKLIYLSHTRPDIAYAVGVVSQFMHQPQVAHIVAVFRIIRYLKGTPNLGVLFRPNGHLNIQIYTDVDWAGDKGTRRSTSGYFSLVGDADWAGDKGTRRSTSGYFSLVGGNLVTWRSNKQKVVALSSVEAEFRGIAKGVAEALWIRKLLSEVG
nr:putative ribonuclease H-like domain-containing protein [Tanacetum cinerariifolium]